MAETDLYISTLKMM